MLPITRRIKERQTMLAENADIIVTAYRDDLEPVESIASRYGVMRKHIYRLLKNNDVSTAKTNRVERQCPTCGKTVLRTRAKARNTEKSFCDSECYVAYIETLGEEYVQSSYHCREARKIVKEHFPELTSEMRVHHEDHNNTHNHCENLRVFANQSDHLKYHRGDKTVKPIWDGRI